MALIERHREPTPRELKVFGLLVGPFFGLIGALVLWRTGSRSIATVCWVIAIVFATVYNCAPPVRRPIYAAWMAVLYPVGWVVSHALLAMVYFGWVTPVGLLMRLCGYDPMRRRLYRGAQSNWIRRKPIRNVNRYFRQY